MVLSAGAVALWSLRTPPMPIPLRHVSLTIQFVHNQNSLTVLRGPL